MPKLKKETKQLLKLALRSDGVDDREIHEFLATLEGATAVKAERSPSLVTQVEAARLASVSRFTIRKMAATGKLHPVELLPGLIRYRVNELLAL
jgi:hypothetical protein